MVWTPPHSWIPSWGSKAGTHSGEGKGRDVYPFQHSICVNTVDNQARMFLVDGVETDCPRTISLWEQKSLFWFDCYYCSYFSITFLIGPCKQLKSMCAIERVFATILMLVRTHEQSFVCMRLKFAPVTPGMISVMHVSVQVFMVLTVFGTFWVRNARAHTYCTYKHTQYRLDLDFSHSIFMFPLFSGKTWLYLWSFVPVSFWHSPGMKHTTHTHTWCTHAFIRAQLKSAC